MRRAIRPGAAGALLAALALAGCGPEFQGSPHGYSVIASGSLTGLSVGIDPTTGGPSITLGRRTGYVIIAPRLDGGGQALSEPDVAMCGGVAAGVATGASASDRVLTGEGAKAGC